MEDVSPELALIRNRFKCAQIEIYRSNNAQHLGRTYYGLPKEKGFLFWCDQQKNLSTPMLIRILEDVKKFNVEYAKNEAEALELQKLLQ